MFSEVEPAKQGEARKFGSDEDREEEVVDDEPADKVQKSPSRNLIK